METKLPVQLECSNLAALVANWKSIPSADRYSSVELHDPNSANETS